MSIPHDFDQSEEMYLKVIAEYEDIEQPMPIPEVAERLGISTVSASQMVHRLQQKELLTHTPYKGVRLTELGQRKANGIIRRHRLWERFLTDTLGLPWDRAHEYACRLEHATDDEVTESLADFLGHPETCPHGNPIPDANGKVVALAGEPMSGLEKGAAGRIVRIRDVSPLLLAYLAEREVHPGSTFSIEEIAPFNGPQSVRVGETVHVLGREVADHIMVRVSG